MSKLRYDIKYYVITSKTRIGVFACGQILCIVYIPEWFTGKYDLLSMCFMQHLIRCCIRRYLWKILSGFMWLSDFMWLSGFMWLNGERWRKMAKSGEKLEKMGKS